METFHHNLLREHDETHEVSQESNTTNHNLENKKLMNQIEFNYQNYQKNSFHDVFKIF